MPLTGTTAYDMVASKTGATYRIFVHVPAGSPPDQGWPLLLLTDGNAVIGMAVSALRVQSPYPGGTNTEAGIIVAVGYPSEDAYDPLRRSFDLGPPPGRAYPPFTEDGPEVRTGGAAIFQSFIETEVLPFVERLVPIDRTRRTLAGHSFGGLFALHVLFSGSDVFRRFVAVSPSIYWEDGQLLEAERRYVSPDGAEPITVHLSTGEYEGRTLAPFQYGRADTEQRLANAGKALTLDLAREMADRLGKRPGIEARFEVFGGETHMSVLSAAVSRALNVAFEIRRP